MTFKNPEIIEALRTRFVPAAVDVIFLLDQKDAEGDFFRKILKQKMEFNKKGPQGFFICDAEAALLGYRFTRDPAEVKVLMSEALKKYQPVGTSPESKEGASESVSGTPTLPDGAAVVDVTSKILGGYTKIESWRAKYYQTSLGRDHLWIRKDEVAALAEGRLPEGLKQRIVRYHLVDHTRGKNPHFQNKEVKKADVTFEKGVLRGKVQAEQGPAYGCETEFLGFIEIREGKLIRFDVVAKGLFWGDGHHPGAPEGRFPLAVAFRLSEGKKDADRIPPLGAYDLEEYFKDSEDK